ncbi:unnamed protein product [Calypogeia fissa]
MMAFTSRRRPFLQYFLTSVVAICFASSASVFAIKVEYMTFSNSGCEDFSVEEKCVQPALWDNDALGNYEFAFVNLFATPDAYTLSVVWTEYPVSPAQYQRVVWSANRNHPVVIGSWFTFSPNGSGSLVLYDSDGSEVWSTGTDNMGAMGMDFSGTTGEMIIFGENNQTIWSSFSHPTDTIVAGQQLFWPGMQLISGNSSTNNSEGAYSLVMEPSGLVLYATLGTDPQPYFVWNYFAQSQDAMEVSSLLKTCYSPVSLELSLNGVVSLSNSSLNLNSSLLSNVKNYTSQALCNLQSNYNTIKGNSYPTTANFTFMVLESDGNLRMYVYDTGGLLTEDYSFFNNTQLCGLPGICGNYGVCTGNGQCECPTDSSFLQPVNSSDPSEGCSYSQLSGSLGTSCSANAQVQFDQLQGVDYFPNRFGTPTGVNISMTDCQNLCVENCSCTASFYNSDSGTCYSVLEPLSSMMSTTNSNMTALVKIIVAPKKKSSRHAALWIGVGVSCLLVILVAVILGLVVYMSKKARMNPQSREVEFLDTLPGLPPRYSKKELDAATMGFTKKLGSGGFGTVYEGKLKDGSKIAVKKLESSNESSKSTKDFRAEMATLGSIHHINLVRLRGYCVEGAENMLVYEFMPNGSLDRWLFNQDSESASLMSETLDWDTRYKIALGTARGLAYLHQDCSERIIHLDIKPQNILLDEDFNAKVADFGLSKLVDREETAVVTTMRGTPGYLAPEWLLQAAITDRTDVYSYGIVLFELVAGRKCLDLANPDPRRRYVPGWVLRCLLQGDTLDVVDPRLDIKDSEKQVENVINIALQCIQEEMMHRPSMGNVIQMLEGFVPVPDLERDTLSSKYRFLNLQHVDISSDQSLTSDFSSKSSLSISYSLPIRSTSRSRSSNS